MPIEYDSDSLPELITYLVHYKFRAQRDPNFPPFDVWRVSTPITYEYDFNLSSEELQYKSRLEEMDDFSFRKLCEQVERAQEYYRAQSAQPPKRDASTSSDAARLEGQADIPLEDEDGAADEVNTRQIFPGEPCDAEPAMQALRDEIHALQAKIKSLQVKAFNEGPPVTRERNTLRKILFGMAIQGYAYNPYYPSQPKKSPITDIAEDLARLGTPIDRQTILDHLREAAELVDLPSEMVAQLKAAAKRS